MAQLWTAFHLHGGSLTSDQPPNISSEIYSDRYLNQYFLPPAVILLLLFLFFVLYNGYSMAFHLRNSRKSTLSRSAPLSNLLAGNGGLFLGAAELHSPGYGQITALRGGGIQGKQVDGSSLPMCFLFDAFTRSSLHRTHCQIPFILPYPSSLSPLQESLPLVRRQDFILCLKPKTSLCCFNKFRPFCKDVDSVRSDSDGENESFVVDDAEFETDQKEVGRVCKVCWRGLSMLANLRFGFFCWAAERPGFAHDSRTYNAMMNILGKTRQFETMVSVLEEMGSKDLLTVETFSICIKAFAAAKERKKAVGMFDLMKKYKFKVGTETINCLLDALGRAKLVKEAQVLFEKLENRFTPNLSTYSVLLNGLLRSKKRSDAIKLFEVMKSKGPLPNVRSYTILIKYLCKQGSLKEAVEYLDDMLTSGYEPDAAVYTCLMTGFGNQKKMDMVYRLLNEMKEKGCPPDGRMYNALIKMMANRHLPDDAVKIYKKMIQSGVEPSIHTYNMIMKSYFFARNYEMGCAVWEEMKRNGCCPDENSYTVLIGGLIRRGRSNEACKYLEEMIDKGMKAPQLDYKKFTADFCRAGRANILEDLAQKIKFSGNSDVADLLERWMR
ncbi:Pentatricopeptide repeat-containing protein, mitochondrial [Sesamum angolense]|uniref:Pentatricopeptide repeat-containing protein, mitochondrial n=1 Tax=Sesamum angolense TaxID=2727404 RepID=A0AAE2C326_9LAMI|nr:Pentatricopeptide repeat-containing protein, mitochondrial [Sesamum angolense]